MLDLNDYGLVIGRPSDSTADWFEPVLSRGRGAVFLDTGFLRALLIDDDQYVNEAREHFAKSKQQNFYTTDLVLAEIVRQSAKDSSADYPTRRRRVSECGRLILGDAFVWICSPPRDFVLHAFETLIEARETREDLDLTDCLSLAVLDYAEHRRVFGFDDHFRIFGAALEPRA